MPKPTILFLLIVFSSFLAHAQEICTGSQGENIFLEGDFGSGTANVVATNPGYAPGFTYSTVVAFDDGFYTITNNSGLWSNNFGTWLNIPDNSPDPNGYMMVVNANFSPGKFYEQVVDGLCENTTYNFTADVINFIRIGVANHLLPNVSFLLDGDTKFSSGDIPQDEKWHTYGFSFVTGPGQTSATLTLQNNAPGGIGNDLAIDNISFRPCGPNAIASTDLDGKVCAENFENLFVTADVDGVGVNAFFQWQVSADNGIIWMDIPGATSDSLQITNFSEGNYLYRYVFAASEVNLQNSKCRTFSTPLPLEVVPVLYSINDTICSGNSYLFGTENYESTGTYQDSLISSLGCDSIVTLNLVVVPNLQPQANFNSTHPSCFADSDGQISLTNFQDVYLPVDAMFVNGQEILPPFALSNLSAANYQIQFEDHFGCTGNEEINLVDPPLFAALGLQDTIVRLGQTFQAATLFTYEPESIIWTPTEGLSCSNCLYPNVQASESTTYLGIGFTEMGCTDTFKISVRVDESSVLFIPNAFSPNQDGANDFFNVFSLEGSVLSVLEINIWDRWGGLIYKAENLEANNINQGWDGTIENKPVDPGVYSYSVIVALINNNTIMRSGSITLVR